MVIKLFSVLNGTDSALFVDVLLNFENKSCPKCYPYNLLFPILSRRKMTKIGVEISIELMQNCIVIVVAFCPVIFLVMILRDDLTAKEETT